MIWFMLLCSIDFWYYPFLTYSLRRTRTSSSLDGVLEILSHSLCFYRSFPRCKKIIVKITRCEFIFEVLRMTSCFVPQTFWSIHTNSLLAHFIEVKSNVYVIKSVICYLDMILSGSGGLFFAKPMRDQMYVTMMDPFQIKYGNLLSGALVLPSLMMDLLWVASTLLSLGEHFFCWSAKPVNVTLLYADKSFLFFRSYCQCDTGPALWLLCLYLISHCDHLHAIRRPLLCGLHWRHPALSNLLQFGEGVQVVVEAKHCFCFCLC